MKHGKKYNDSRKAVDSAKQYASEEALSLVCTNAKAKFDETIEAHIRLGVDSRHADQQERQRIVEAAKKIEATEGKAWVDLIYQANGMRRRKAVNTDA